MTHICVVDLTIIGSDNGLSPGRRQAIIWTNAGILLIGPLGTNFSETLIEIQTFPLKKIRLKMSSAKCCSFRLGLNVLNEYNKQRNIWRVSCIWHQESIENCFHPKYVRNWNRVKTNGQGQIFWNSEKMETCVTSFQTTANPFYFNIERVTFNEVKFKGIEIQEEHRFCNWAKLWLLKHP